MKKKNLRLCLDFTSQKELVNWHKEAVKLGLLPDGLVAPAEPADIQTVVATIPNIFVLKRKKA